MSGPFTACPNGRHEEGYAHDFCGYIPGEFDPDRRPLMFCERCGEVRALALAPVEDSAERRLNVTVTAANVTHRQDPPTEVPHD